MLEYGSFLLFLHFSVLFIHLILYLNVNWCFFNLWLQSLLFWLFIHLILAWSGIYHSLFHSGRVCTRFCSLLFFNFTLSELWPLADVWWNLFVEVFMARFTLTRLFWFQYSHLISSMWALSCCLIDNYFFGWSNILFRLSISCSKIRILIDLLPQFLELFFFLWMRQLRLNL